jgi:thioredoxin 1
MPFDPEYHESTLSRADLEKMTGPVLVEFGATWCGICNAFAPQLESLMDDFPAVTHVKVEDGRGKPLGRSFRVKLWPTLVFLRDGQVVQQLARPSRSAARAGLEAITKTVGNETSRSTS